MKGNSDKGILKSLPDNGIAIQGFEGSFHQVAARQFFGKDVPVICCSTFRELIKKAGDKKLSEGAVMAIENSIAGSILPNYNLLQQSDLKIVGEVYLQIKQNLIVNPGVVLEDIKEVHSHPMAILQCLDYLEKYNWKLVETEDTALSAKHIHQYKSKHIAAIASKLAADLYELDIITPNIHTAKNNYTRFLVLKRREDVFEPEQVNKASISFSTNHTRGSLARVLTKIADAGINLSKLQSFPKPGSDWKYYFHADLEFDNVNDYNKLIKKILPMISELKVYGIYQSGNLK
ncbi:MAG: chorismate mutase [Sphingobacteriales bacterium]|nr:MAG: chorismate mutase [Sphingobacteriales bacterium]